MYIDKLFNNIADDESPESEVDILPTFEDLWNYQKELYQFCVIVYVKNGLCNPWVGKLGAADINKLKQRIEVISDHVCLDIPEVFVNYRKETLENSIGADKLTYSVDSWELPIFFNLTKEEASKFVRLISSLYKKLKLKNCQIEFKVFRTAMGDNIFNDIRNDNVHYSRELINYDMGELTMINFLVIDEDLKNCNTYHKIKQQMQFPIGKMFSVEPLDK